MVAICPERFKIRRRDEAEDELFERISGVAVGQVLPTNREPFVRQHRARDRRRGLPEPERGN